MPGVRHLGGGALERLNHVADVVESLSVAGQPVGMDAGAGDRLDQLVLRAARGERQPQRPIGRPAAVLAALTVRAEQTFPPRPGRKRGVEAPSRALEVTHHERDLKRRAPGQ
jgi:hypothetical protein